MSLLSNQSLTLTKPNQVLVDTYQPINTALRPLPSRPVPGVMKGDPTTHVIPATWQLPSSSFSPRNENQIVFFYTRQHERIREQSDH